LREQIETASVDHPILILVNTLEQAYRLLSVLEYRENSKTTNVSIEFNKPKCVSGEYEIDVVINPVVDKIQYKRYNNIILYDMFYFAEQLNIFTHEDHAKKTRFLYDCGDEQSNLVVLESIIPTRDQLVAMYRYLKNSKSNEI